MKPTKTRGRPIGGEQNSELAQLRRKLNLSQRTAAAIAAGLLGSCDRSTWSDWEAARDGAKAPPVVLAHFRRLAGTVPAGA